MGKRLSVNAGAIQCGYCTPGMLMSGVALLNRYPHPTWEQIRKEMEGNLCRCTGYARIADTILLAAEKINAGTYMETIQKYFYNGGLNCAESTMRTLIEEGVTGAPPESVRMMSGFGGGMQRGSTYGAVVAAVAALGWAAGRTEPEHFRSKNRARPLDAPGLIRRRELRSTCGK